MSLFAETDVENTPTVAISDIILQPRNGCNSNDPEDEDEEDLGADEDFVQSCIHKITINTSMDPNTIRNKLIENNYDYNKIIVNYTQQHPQNDNVFDNCVSLNEIIVKDKDDNDGPPTSVFDMNDIKNQLDGEETHTDSKQMFNEFRKFLNESTKKYDESHPVDIESVRRDFIFADETMGCKL